MDIEREVETFVAKGKDLFRSLRAEGDALSDLALQILRAQLHILHVESARLLHLRIKNNGSPTSSKKSPVWPPLQIQSPDDLCSHSRLVDDFVNMEGKTLVYCLECRTIITDPHIKVGQATLI